MTKRKRHPGRHDNIDRSITPVDESHFTIKVRPPAVQTIESILLHPPSYKNSLTATERKRVRRKASALALSGRGFGTSEIAHRLNCSKTTVNNDLYQARRMLWNKDRYELAKATFVPGMWLYEYLRFKELELWQQEEPPFTQEERIARRLATNATLETQDPALTASINLHNEAKALGQAMAEESRNAIEAIGEFVQGTLDHVCDAEATEDTSGWCFNCKEWSCTLQELAECNQIFCAGHSVCVVCGRDNTVNYDS
jgi:DNA-binding CsgD family transcriptional regulator